MTKYPATSRLAAAALLAAFLAVPAFAQSTLYLNTTGYAANNAFSSASSWWADAEGTIANVSTPSTATNILAFNNLVASAFTGRTGGGSGGTMNIYGFQVLDPAGAITATTANNAAQTVTMNGAVGIDMSSAAQDFTFKAGHDTTSSRNGFLRLGASQSWKVQAGRTLTIGAAVLNDLNANNTKISSTSGTKTLTLSGNGTTALGTVVLNADFISSQIVVIDGTGSSSSGGNVHFNGSANTLTSLSITNATATFASGGTTSGTVTVNSTGVLAGAGTLSGAATINGALRTNTAPIDATSRLTFGNTFTLGGTSTTTFDIDGANFTGVTVSTAESLTFGGDLAFNFVNGVTVGTYDLFAFTDSDTGSFANVSVTSIGALNLNANLWSGTYGGHKYEFSQATGDLIVSAVPEPSSFAAIAGVLGLGFAALRRRRAA